MSRFFQKVGDGATRLFSKISNAGPKLLSGIKSETPKILGRFSDGLGNAGNFANMIGRNAIKYGENPLIQSAVPEANLIGRGIQAFANTSGNVLHGLSNLTNQKNYRGDIHQVSTNALEKIKNIKKDADKLIVYQ